MSSQYIEEYVPISRETYEEINIIGDKENTDQSTIRSHFTGKSWNVYPYQDWENLLFIVVRWVDCGNILENHLAFLPRAGRTHILPKRKSCTQYNV